MGRSPPPPPKRGRSPGIKHGGIAKRTDRPVHPPPSLLLDAENVRRHAERLRVLRDHSGIPLRNVELLVGHGQLPENVVTNEFVIPPRTAIVFLSPVGMTLPQDIINDDFYQLFTNSNHISDLLAGRLSGEIVSPYFRDWKQRIYGPGDRCPNMEIDSGNDPCWNGIGLHSLPLTGPLRDYRAVVPCLEVRQHEENHRRRRAAIWDESYYEKWTGRRVLASPGRGAPKIALREITIGPQGGVLFVIACRALASRAAEHHILRQHVGALPRARTRADVLHARRLQRIVRDRIAEHETRHDAVPSRRPRFDVGTMERYLQNRYEVPLTRNAEAHEYAQGILRADRIKKALEAKREREKEQRLRRR